MSAQQPGLLKSSIAKKYWMALTGLFLCTFLVGHLAGNLQLIFGDQEQFNAYAKFMTTNPAVKALSYLTYFSILFHTIDGILLTRQNKAARPVAYAYNKPERNSKWASRNMALLGVITLFFIIAHMRAFWFEMHWGEVGIDAAGNKDLWTVTVTAFQQWWYVAFYVVCMAAIAFHLSHGFQSAFQSIGLRSKSYTPIVEKAGLLFAIGVPTLFAIIPVYIFLFIDL